MQGLSTEIFLAVLIIFWLAITGSVFLGYWIGSLSGFRSKPKENPVFEDQGSTAEPDQGDIFRDALTDPAEGDERKATIIIDRRLS